MVLKAAKLDVHFPTLSTFIGLFIGMNFVVSVHTTLIAELFLTDATFILVYAGVIHSVVFEIEFHSECFPTVLALIHLSAIMHSGVYSQCLWGRKLATTLMALIRRVLKFCIHSSSIKVN